MSIKIKINRTGEKLLLLRTKETIRTHFAADIWDAYGYKHLNALDINNWNKIGLIGAEINSLLIKSGTLYKFVEWAGQYPFKGIIIEKLGKEV